MKIWESGGLRMAGQTDEEENETGIFSDRAYAREPRHLDHQQFSRCPPATNRDKRTSG